MIYVVEPHSDDAFLSMHEHMTAWIQEGKEVTILTAFHDMKRGLEARRYADSIGASWKGAGFVTSGEGLTGYKPTLPKWPWCGIKLVATDRIVFPIGLQHPEHLAVRQRAPSFSQFYLDTPYQAKLKLGEQLVLRTQGKLLLSIRYPSRRKWKSIEHFKSQSKFFHFNSPDDLHRIPEIIVQ